jgi:hypothetical protein
VSLRNHVIFFRMLHSFINRLDFASVASLRVGSSTNRTTKALHRTGRGAVAHDSVVPSARGSSANGAVWRPEAVRALEIHRLCTREGNALRLYYPTTNHTHNHTTCSPQRYTPTQPRLSVAVSTADEFLGPMPQAALPTSL